MTAAHEPVPPDFTSEDYRQRMQRVVDSATTVGLAGVVVTPGPDLVWLTGYRPTAITERLTMLVLRADERPSLLVPVLERPDVESAEGVEAVTLVDWADGTDPYQAAAPLLGTAGTYGISDSAWALHLLGFQRELPGHGIPVPDRLPPHDACGKGQQRGGAAGSRGGSG